MGAVKDAEIIAALEEIMAAKQDPEGYYTATELATMWNVGKVAAQRRLGMVKAAGRLDVARVLRPSIDGRMMPSPAYRILPALAVP